MTEQPPELRSQWSEPKSNEDLFSLVVFRVSHVVRCTLYQLLNEVDLLFLNPQRLCLGFVCFFFPTGQTESCRNLRRLVGWLEELVEPLVFEIKPYLWFSVVRLVFSSPLTRIPSNQDKNSKCLMAYGNVSALQLVKA